MKTKVLLSLLLLSISVTSFCKTWTVVNSGATFSPDSITIMQGDSVQFTLASVHNANEVSLDIWQAGGNTHLTGGFETAFGGGLVLPAQLAVGTHYFVCTPHAAIGMKGVIIVQNATQIAANYLKSDISIYPNPSSDFIKVKSSRNTLGATYVITDQIGRQVLTGKLINENTLVDINQLPSGIYMFQVGQQSNLTFKLVKK